MSLESALSGWKNAGRHDAHRCNCAASAHTNPASSVPISIRSVPPEESVTSTTLAPCVSEDGCDARMAGAIVTDKNVALDGVAPDAAPRAIAHAASSAGMRIWLAAGTTDMRKGFARFNHPEEIAPQIVPPRSRNLVGRLSALL